MGLRRGFIQAGAQNLLMTLWPISDEVTVQFMSDFYDAAHKSGNAPEALAEVQRNWLAKLRTEIDLAQAVNLAGPFIRIRGNFRAGVTRSGRPLPQIRAANFDETISDQDFAGRGPFLWTVDGFESQILGCVKTKRFQVVFPSSLLVVARLSFRTESITRICLTRCLWLEENGSSSYWHGFMPRRGQPLGAYTVWQD